MEKRKIVVITAGLSQPSSSRMLADALAKSTTEALELDGVTAETTTIELREHAHAVTDMLLTRFASPELREVIDQVKSADGIIAVTPIFTAEIGRASCRERVKISVVDGAVTKKEEQR